MDRIKKIASAMPKNVGQSLEMVPQETKEKICEIRVSRSFPVTVVTTFKTYFLGQNGELFELFSDTLPTVSGKEIYEIFLKCCNHSVYAHQNEISEGFLSCFGGCRVGISGEYKNGNFVRVHSLNIRVPKRVIGCADSIFSYSDEGLLIAGPPGSGKTTVLRELVSELSFHYRISVIDSRHEITDGFKMGPLCDTVFADSKSEGANMALRTLSPQIIAFDEIGSISEVNSLKDCFNAGVSVITTAHAGSFEELKKRSITNALLASGAIKTAVILPKIKGEKPEIKRVMLEEKICRK